MKKVFFIRHAKSSWADLNMRDIDRPLNGRGARDAPRMAAYLKENFVGVGSSSKNSNVGFLSSPSKRTRETLSYFQETLKISDSQIVLDQNLYHPSAHTIIESLYQASIDMNTVLLFTHNPGISYLANLIDSSHIENVPTCGILCVSFEIDDWKDASIETATLDNFIFPKMLQS